VRLLCPPHTRWCCVSVVCVLQASVTGNLTVSFYDAEAGWGSLGPVLLAARTNPQVRGGGRGRASSSSSSSRMMMKQAGPIQRCNAQSCVLLQKGGGGGDARAVLIAGGGVLC